MRTLLLFSGVLLSAAPVRGEVAEYLLVFAANGDPYRATEAHTFATLVRVEETPGEQPRLIDHATISWLPATMEVQPFALRPEPGHNFALVETLDHYIAGGNRISLWGPYRVKPELGEAFRRRVVALQRCYRYKSPDIFQPIESVANCARAVEELIEPRRRYIGAFGYGEAASGYAVKKFTPWLIEPCRTHPWVESLIGLEGYDFVRRPYGFMPTRREKMRSSLGLR